MSTHSRGSDRFDLPLLLDALAGVDYIIVGGVAGTLHGSPRVTFDLDIVPDRAETNVERLDVALTRLGARIREPGQRRLTVSLRFASHHQAPEMMLPRCGGSRVDRSYPERRLRRTSTDGVATLVSQSWRCT
jgi:hypothetical protein